LCAAAQDILVKNIQWQSSQVSRTDKSEQFSHPSIFITKTSTIEWIQKGGAKVITYQIQSREGTWSNVSGIGELKFNVRQGTLDGNLVFKRTKTGIYVTLNFPIKEKNAMPYQFLIDNIQTN